jgi:phenylacetate-coenzyme A ligase PaaK-like adenylate-forming protein
LEHAALHSSFYRRRWGGTIPKASDYHKLEPVTKKDLLDKGFDAALTQPTLSKESLRKLLGQRKRGPYVVLATSGTTGEPVIVPYSRREWIEGLAYMIRGESRRSTGMVHALRTALRMASVATHNPIHASTQLSSSLEFLPGARLSLSAGMPLEEQIERLDAFQPRMLWGYPSAIDLLARAQLEGRLHIHPERALTGGETMPSGCRERLRMAWGAELFDSYGLTEGLVFGWECREHCGLHIDDDAVILEVVDEQDRVLPPGKKGKAILLTNLYNWTLPILRYRVGDVMALSSDACPCGVPFARITAIEGRRDEMLSLQGAEGQVVEVHPAALEAVLEEMAGVRRFQLRSSGGALQVLVVPREPSDGLAGKIQSQLARVLASFKVDPEVVQVDLVAELKDELGSTSKRRRILGSLET